MSGREKGEPTASSAQYLIVRVGDRLAALPLETVVETMRPLPVGDWAYAPAIVRGIATIRGAATPVVQLHVLLGIHVGAALSRFVTVKTGARVVAIAVEDVLGVRALEERQLEDLPPLLSPGPDEIVSAIATVDGELVTVLRLAKLVPEAVWASIEAEARS